MTRSIILAVATQLALTVALLPAIADAQGFAQAPAVPSPYSTLLPEPSAYPTTGSPVVTEWSDPSCATSTAIVPANPNQYPTSASMIVPADQQPAYLEPHVYYEGDPYPGPAQFALPADAWCWQMLPDGLIYRSYWAGPREPRMGVTMFRNQQDNSFWDPTVGARVAVIRYGDFNPIHPQGWEFQVEGAALPRLTLDNIRDLDSVDFRGGGFLTYGVGDWQFKLGYDHLSSHLGDEFMVNNPTVDRINYVRDSIVAGASVYPVPEVRLYTEAGYAFNTDGGAEPWEFQFGVEWSKAGATGIAGSPFLAANAHLREEVNFAGDFTVQAGWMWRGRTGQTMRIGAHYMNGKSTQYQNFDKFEEQIGAGVWYDF